MVGCNLKDKIILFSQTVIQGKITSLITKIQQKIVHRNLVKSQTKINSEYFVDQKDIVTHYHKP